MVPLSQSPKFQCDDFATLVAQSIIAPLTFSDCHMIVTEPPLFASIWPPRNKQRSCRLKSHMLYAGVIIVAIAAPLAAQAQGIPGGVSHGASEGYRIAGPVGAIVGVPIGGVIGGVEGLLGITPAYYEPPPRVVHRRVVRKKRVYVR
jgi:hypothetical protein